MGSAALLRMTHLQLCNSALARLGEARVYDLAENEFVTVQCATQLPLAMSEVLRSHRWNFAQARALLARLSDPPAFGKAYAYALPSDCVRVLEVNGISGSGAVGDEWEIEGQRLLTHCTTVQVLYIRIEDDLTVWDPLAVEWLTLCLAAKLAPTVQGGSTSKANELKEEINKLAAPLARRIDANESRRSKENMMVAMLEGSQAIAARESGV